MCARLRRRQTQDEGGKQADKKAHNAFKLPLRRCWTKSALHGWRPRAGLALYSAAVRCGLTSFSGRAVVVLTRRVTMRDWTSETSPSPKMRSRSMLS